MFKFIKKLYRKLFTEKYYGMLPESDLKTLKEIAIKVQGEIDFHKKNDENDKDDAINQVLYGALYSVKQCIEIIENSNDVSF